MSAALKHGSALSWRTRFLDRAHGDRPPPSTRRQAAAEPMCSPRVLAMCRLLSTLLRLGRHCSSPPTHACSFPPLPRSHPANALHSFLLTSYLRSCPISLPHASCAAISPLCCAAALMATGSPTPRSDCFLSILPTPIPPPFPFLLLRRFCLRGGSRPSSSRPPPSSSRRAPRATSPSRARQHQNFHRDRHPGAVVSFNSGGGLQPPHPRRCLRRAAVVLSLTRPVGVYVTQLATTHTLFSSCTW